MSQQDRSTSVTTPGILEALLFAAETPLSAATLAEIVELTPAATRDLLEDLRLRYEQDEGALQLVELANGYRLVTKPQYAPYIRALRKPRTQRLSRAGLESLAIIAYRQPVTAPEFERLRGVDSSGVLQTLLEHGLIEVAGRKEGLGRPRLYRTTQKFLDQFGLANLGELPELPEGEVAEMTESLFAEPAEGQGNVTSRGLHQEPSESETTEEPAESSSGSRSEACLEDGLLD